MIVDDEIMIKKGLSKLIDDSPYGFRISGEAEDGGEALALWEKEPVDLIITDISMPVMDGLEFIREVRKKDRAVDIVILSGYDDFAYAQQGLRYGVADYLLKPVREEQVYEILTKTAYKLDVARKAKEQRGFWLQECKKAAEQIAEHVWLLNEEEAIRTWAEFMRRLERLERLEPGAGTIRIAVEDLLALLHGELILRGDEESAEMDPVPQLRSGAENDLLELVKVGLIDMMSRIRQTRNWGQYHPVRKALAFIHDRLSDPELSMQQAAAETGMSVSYFSRCFKDEMGISFTEYVIRRRMEHAKELLLEAGSKTYEIAWAVGYTDYPHFAKSFKKWYGLSPTEYKKRMTGF